MNIALITLFWVGYTGAFATMQGFLIPSLRKEPPAYNQAKINDFALHKLGFVAWLLPVLLLPSWLHLAIALIIRFALFDLFINMAANDSFFYVGHTAKTDKMLRWIAGKLRIPAPALSAGIKAVVSLFLCLIILKLT